MNLSIPEGIERQIHAFDSNSQVRSQASSIEKPETRNQKLETQSLDTRHPTLDTRKAAKSFEKVLVQQFVNVMTEQMFKSNLSGEDGPGWMKAYGDKQRQVLSDVLTEHLVESGTFDISSTLLQHWQRKGLIATEG